MGVSGRLPSFSGPPAFVSVHLAGSCGRALRDVSWIPASSPGTNPLGVEALVVVEEDGARGGGVVRGDSEGLFKGLAVGLAVVRRC